MDPQDNALFEDALRGLTNGDFTRLDPLFVSPTGVDCAVVRWHKAGRFSAFPGPLNEALTCACFNGRIEAARYLLALGLDPAAGVGTGMSALHWAANRGQVEAVQLLLEHRAPLELRNNYGGTVLGCAVWSAIHEPRTGQIDAIRALLRAGADVSQAQYPSGVAPVDQAIELALKGS